MWGLLVLATLGARAADCDAAALKDAVEAATPATVATAWSNLAACDPDAAKEEAEQTFTTALPGTDVKDAMLKALQLHLDDEVRGYLQRIPSDERSKAIGWLGDQCADHEEVGPFFVESHEVLGPDFWANRWHRGLTDCRTDGVRKLLSDALYGNEVGMKTAVDRAQFFSVLEVYARNLRADALPTLTKLATELQDEDEVTYVINAFGDAVGVGSEDGVDHDVAKQAVTALQKLGPGLPPRAVEQGRSILQALGNDQAADAYAKFRWPAAFRNGHYAYRYAVVATETTTCGNGKKQAVAHYATFTEPGKLWPEEVADLVKDKLAYEWQLDGSHLCRGDFALTWSLPHEPFETEDASQAWLEEQLATFEQKTSGFKKSATKKEDPFQL